MQIRSFFFLLNFLLLGILQAQKVSFVDGDKQIDLEFISWNEDSLQAENSLGYIYSELVEAGYWDSRLDSIQIISGSWLAYGTLGRKYAYKDIRVHEKIRKFTGKNAAFYNKIPLSDRRKRILKFYLDNGYPFARVYFDSLEIEDYNVKARINVEDNGLQLLDSLAIKTSGSFSRNVLSQMLQFQKGQVYNESEILDISSILKQYNYLNIPSEPRVLFTPNKNVLYLYVEEKNAHYFDGLIGFASDEAGEVSFRGKLEFKLENAFHRGEDIYLKLDAQEDASQTLKTHLGMPFIVSSWGVEADLNIHKQDSSFVKTDYGLGVQYHWKSFWKLGLGFEKSESSITKEKVLITDVLSAFEKTLYYGSVEYQKLDRVFQSREGAHFRVLLKAGSRTEKEISKSEYFVDANLAWYFPIKQSFSIKTGLLYKNRISDGLGDNNLLFLGGSQNMRGFLENQFRLASYLVFSPSLRYHFSEDYMLELFTDQGITYHPYDEGLDEQHIWSSGIQMEMPIKSGWLYLGYAVGKQGDATFSISEGVVHFGLRNTF